MLGGFRAVLACMVALLLTAACSAGVAEERPVVFRVGYGGDPVTLDPRLSPPTYSIFLTPVYETLIKPTKDGGYAPGLATEWSLSDEARRLALTLRPGVTFQDGTPFDAEAVKANIEATKASRSPVARNLSVVDRVEVIDDTHVVLHLNAPGGHLAGVLASETGMMISPASLSAPDLATRPVGTGPFRLTELTGGRTTYTKWDGYWNADAIAIDGIEIYGFPEDVARMSALRSGELDAAFLFPSQIEQAEQAGKATTVSPRTYFHGLILNTSRSEFSNPLVRQAIDLAINRTAIADSLYDGQCVPTRRPYPDGYWAAAENPDPPRYDPERARQLLAEAGLTNGFTFTLTVSNITTFQRLGEVLQGELGTIGITVRLNVVDNPQLTAIRQAGDYEAVAGAYESGRPDPTTYLSDYYLPGGNFNPGGFDVPGGRELVTAARSSTDVAERQGPVQRFLDAVDAIGSPVVPVCFPGAVEADSEQVVSGVTVSMVGDYDFTTVRMSTD